MRDPESVSQGKDFVAKLSQVIQVGSAPVLQSWNKACSNL